MDHKERILALLEVMRTKSIADKEIFKARAYAKVASQIKDLPAVRTYDDVSHLQALVKRSVIKSTRFLLQVLYGL
jgi:hypothetical protein